MWKVLKFFTDIFSIKKAVEEDSGIYIDYVDSTVEMKAELERMIRNNIIANIGASYNSGALIRAVNVSPYADLSVHDIGFDEFADFYDLSYLSPDGRGLGHWAAFATPWYFKGVGWSFKPPKFRAYIPWSLEYGFRGYNWNHRAAYFDGVGHYEGSRVVREALEQASTTDMYTKVFRDTLRAHGRDFK